MKRGSHLVLISLIVILSNFFVGQITFAQESLNEWQLSQIKQELAVSPVAPRNIILISWDGVQRNHLKELRYKLPYLALLYGVGKIVELEVTHATDTKAGHAQMLTGYEPNDTGVHWNKKFQPIPEGYTLFERVERFFGPDNIITMMITGKKENLSADPPDPETGYPGGPFYNAAKVIDVVDIAQRDASEVGPLILEALEQYSDMPFFAFFHFSDPDHNGHSYGEDSREYSRAIRICDYWLGRIIGKLWKLDVLSETLIYVTTDHGFDEESAAFPVNPEKPGHSHIMAPYIFLATNDVEIIRSGNQRELAPTILQRFGLNIESLSPKFPGRPLTEPKKHWTWMPN